MQTNTTHIMEAKEQRLEASLQLTSAVEQQENYVVLNGLLFM